MAIDTEEKNMNQSHGRVLIETGWFSESYLKKQATHIHLQWYVRIFFPTHQSTKLHVLLLKREHPAIPPPG